MKGIKKAKGLLLLFPYLVGFFIKLEAGIFVSLILSLEVLLLRIWALDRYIYFHELEKRSYGYLLLGVLLGLLIKKSDIAYYGIWALAGFLGLGVNKKYRLPLYLLVQTGAFQALDASNAIFSSFYYGILMIFSALALLERSRQGD